MVGMVPMLDVCCVLGPLLSLAGLIVHWDRWTGVYWVDDGGAGLDQRCIYHSSVQPQFDPRPQVNLTDEEGVNSYHH